MITIGQIAEMAGVSKSTVSRVINSSGYVHSKTRDKVERIICEYGYSPSATAQNLSRRKTNTVGVVVPELDNTFFSELLTGAAEVADAYNLTMIVCNTANNAEKERQALHAMEQQRVKGVIFTSARGYSDEKDVRSLQLLLKNMKVPVVLVDREIENVQWDGVFYENFQSGYLSAERLISLGCRKIGIIKGDMQLKHARQRYAGYAQAMEDHGLIVRREFVYDGNYTAQQAYRITKGIFRQKEQPEALVLSNNATMLGFMKGLTECRKILGKDIQAVGIDHIPVLDMIGFQYDCVTRDTKGMGQSAMHLLLERLRNPKQERKILMIPCIERFRSQALQTGEVKK